MATTNNITGQLIRIGVSANTIWNKATAMALYLPAGSYWDLTSLLDQTIYGSSNKITGTDSPEASYVVDSFGNKNSFNFGIDAVAAAINNVNVRNYLGKVTNSAGNYLTKETLAAKTALNAGDSVYIPVGYNKTAFTITANSIGSLLEATTAAAKYLYTRKTAYIKNADGNPEKITGSLSTVYLYNPEGAYDASKVNGTKLKVSINKDWATNNKLDPAELLDTNILYRSTLATAAVTGNSTTNGTVGKEANLTIGNYDVYYGAASTGKKAKKYLKLTPAAGYYDSPWYTDVLYAPTISQNIEITSCTDAEGNETHTANTLTVKAGYYPSDIIITPVIKDLEGKTESILNYTDITLSGDATNGDYTFSNSQVVFTPKSYNDKTYDFFREVTLVECSSKVRNDGLLEVTKGGWINHGVYGNAYGNLIPMKSENVTVSSGWNPTTSVINSKTFTIKIDKNHYTDPNNDFTKLFTVQSGSHTYTAHDKIFNYTNSKIGETTAPTINVTITKKWGKLEDSTTAGWIAASSKTTYFEILDWIKKGNTANTDDFYTVGAAGWINKDSYVGTTLFNPDTSNDGKAAAGYDTSKNVYDPNNAAANLVIPAGAVLVNPITINKITSGEATYKIDEDDLSNTNDGDSNVAKFKVTAAMDLDKNVSTYMTAITIDMSLILSQLLAI